jgi:hypothetical protein
MTKKSRLKEVTTRGEKDIYSFKTREQEKMTIRN